MISLIILIPLLGTANLRTYVDHKVFFAPDVGPYLEVYLAFDGSTVAYAPTQAGLFRAEVELTMLLRQGEKINDFRKLIISGPEVQEDQYTDIIDQQRFSVENGDYQLELQFRDVHHPDSLTYTHIEPITVSVQDSGVFFSDIELVSAFTKSEAPNELTRSGYDLVPYVSDYYPPESTELNFYAELYNSRQEFGDSAMFLISYHIASYETNELVGNFKKVSRANTDDVNVIMANMDISDLGTGNYDLVIEARDRENQLINKKKLFFVRNNPQHYEVDELADVEIQLTFVANIDDKDTLVEYINSTRPISNDLERRILDDGIENMELAMLKRYFYTFWHNRNSEDPSIAWQDYHAAVKQVNKFYSTRIKKGYESDRGYVHLKYGAPNSISNRPADPDAYPYEIWHYYKALEYNNKRFVFYMPDLVTNDYVLLHSEVPGEMKNPNWNALVHSRNTPLNNVNTIRSNSASGEFMEDQFVLPR